MTIVPTQASPATQVAHANAPISDLDPYSDEALIEPWAMYQELQGLGSAVWLTRYQMFALTRFDSVIRALKDASAFSPASGVMMNDEMNEVLRGNTLCSDGADHQRSRRIIGKPLSPTAVQRRAWTIPSVIPHAHVGAARSNSPPCTKRIFVIAITSRVKLRG